MENELLPVVSGILAGVVLGGITARRRPYVWLVLSVVLGLLATVVSGEFKASWAYLLIDIPLVAGVSAASFYAVRWVRRRQLALT